MLTSPAKSVINIPATSDGLVLSQKLKLQPRTQYGVSFKARRIDGEGACAVSVAMNGASLSGDQAIGMMAGFTMYGAYAYTSGDGMGYAFTTIDVNATCPGAASSMILVDDVDVAPLQ